MQGCQLSLINLFGFLTLSLTESCAGRLTARQDTDATKHHVRNRFETCSDRIQRTNSRREEEAGQWEGSCVISMWAAAEIRQCLTDCTNLPHAKSVCNFYAFRLLQQSISECNTIHNFACMNASCYFPVLEYENYMYLRK